MIHVEYYADDDVSFITTRHYGFRVEADGLSTAEMFELERRAAQQAIDRYLTDRERLYADPPAELRCTTLWLVHGLGRLPSSFIWEEFHVYFLIAKVRILLSEHPQPVACSRTVDRAVSRALESLCDEFEVPYRSHFQHRTGPDRRRTLRSLVGDFLDTLHERATVLVDYWQRWLIFLVFILFRPLLSKLYSTIRGPVDVRFWLHPTEDHRTRLYDLPSDLESGGVDVGYALYDFIAINDFRAFVYRGLGAVHRAFDSTQPLPVEWYIAPEDFRQVLVNAPRLREAIQGVGTRARETGASPEFTYLARQLETVSTPQVIQILLLNRAIEGFSASVREDVWIHARGLPKLTSRLLALAGHREDMTTVGVSPHYHSDTRVGYNFTDTEVEGREAAALPDLYVVFEPLSAETLCDQRLPTRIAVARDKIVAETYKDGGNNVIRDRLTSATSESVSPPDASQMRVLIILTLPVDNTEIVGALGRAIGDFPDIKLVFKPHPLVPQGKGLFDGLREKEVDFEVTAPTASLADLVAACDICIAMYSTAAIPALARATPVIWVPLGSPGHVRMDLIEEVGIRADDPDNLANVLDRLVHDGPFYVEQARECARFARANLIPDAEAPSLQDLIKTQIGSENTTRQ